MEINSELGISSDPFLDLRYLTSSTVLSYSSAFVVSVEETKYFGSRITTVEKQCSWALGVFSVDFGADLDTGRGANFHTFL